MLRSYSIASTRDSERGEPKHSKIPPFQKADHESVRIMATAMPRGNFLGRESGEQRKRARAASYGMSAFSLKQVRREEGRRKRLEIRAASRVFDLLYQVVPGSFAVDAFTGCCAGLVLFCTSLLEAFLAFFGFFMQIYVWPGFTHWFRAALSADDE